MRALLLAAALAGTAAAREVPRLQGRVNDHAGLMSYEARAGLEVHLRDFEQATGRQIAILTVNSLEGAPLESFSLEVARAWKLGRAGKNDGVLFLISKNDRKLRIEVGHGLEGVLTDALAGRILDYEVAPRLRAGGFEEGVVKGATAIMGTIDGSYVPPEHPRPRPKAPAEDFGPMGIYLFTLFILIGCGSTLEGPLGWPYGIFVGLIAIFFCPNHPYGAYARWFFSPASMALYAVLRHFGIGLEPLLRWLNKHGPRDSHTSYGSGGYGGGSSSSSDSGGSFSGGGGSFGGGGASGSW